MLSRQRLLSLTFAACAAIPAIVLPSLVAAQAPVSGVVKFNGDAGSNGTVGGFSVGPYLSNLTGFNTQMGVLGNATINNAIIWCVDWQHSANSSNDSYYSTAFTSNVNGIVGNGDFSETRRNSEADYRKAAWLIEQYNPLAANSGLGLYNGENIQGTIWNLFGGTYNGNGDFYTLTVPQTFTLTRNWYVLSDDDLPGEALSQEYLTSTAQVVPEPSTYVLMTVGMLAVFGAARRRKAKA